MQKHDVSLAFSETEKRYAHHTHLFALMNIAFSWITVIRLPLFIQIPLYKYTCKALCTSFNHTVVAVLHKDRHRIV